MRRTQLYLDDDLWNALHSRARIQGTTISNLVRQAIRDQYLGKLQSHGVELGDALIAAAACLTSAQLWTNNRKHYPMKELSFY